MKELRRENKLAEPAAAAKSAVHEPGREDQDVARVATVRRRAAPDVGGDIAGDALVRPEDEDALGVRCGELAAAHRRAGLIEHRCPLRRRLGQVNCVHLVVTAVMPHPMDLGGIGENAIGVKSGEKPG